MDYYISTAIDNRMIDQKAYVSITFLALYLAENLKPNYDA